MEVKDYMKVLMKSITFDTIFIYITFDTLQT